jgi:uncharacterized protein (TIGR03083 family)
VLDRTAYLTHLESDAGRLVDAVREAPDLSVPVAACPGWTVRDLVEHVGSVHRWARAALTSSTPPDAVPLDLAGDDHATWLARGVADLLGDLRRTDPATPCWGMGPAPRTVAFWLRRQAHETLVHRWDVETALGGAAGLDRDLAWDGVLEVTQVLYPRQVRLGRRPAAPALALADPATAERTALEGGSATTVSGSAPDLLLVLWGRRAVRELLDASVLEVDGDPDLAIEVLGSQLVP